LELYHKITDKDLLIRRINLVANRIVDEREAEHENEFIQLDIFSDTEETKAQNEQKEIAMAKEKQIQKAMLDIRKRHGKNAILKATSLEEGATAIDRNKQIGGHKA
ncbi:MAG: DNA methylase, partial [Clostridia bacterium]|nr:DNA methylase [Clostridia bacterium]